MMKKVFLTTLIGLFFSCATFAQGYKIAYAKVDLILAKLPDMKVIQSQLQTEQQQLEKQLMQKNQEFEQKVADYQRTGPMMNALAKADKERELQDLQNRLEQFEQGAQTQLQKKQDALLVPLFKKIEVAIAAVAKEKGYQYVLSHDGLNSRDNIILYAQNESDDITAAVLGKLGVTVTPAELK